MGLAALFHRSGILAYLRDQWRAEDASTRRDLKAYSTREVNASAASVRGEVRQLRADHEGRFDAEHASVSGRLETLEHEVERLRAVLAMNAERRETRHPHALEFDRIAAHVLDAIARAPLHHDPTAHLVIRSLFPDDTYLALLDSIPPDACFTQRDRTKQNFRLREAGVAPDFTLRVSSFVEDRIIPEVVVPALLRRFQSRIEDAYAQRHGPLGPAVAALPHVASAGRLMLRRRGYHLDPHIDPSRVILTCLTYWARPGDSAAFGTQLFRINGTPAIDRTSTYYPEHHGHACDLVTTVPFIANTAVVFLNVGAAHGADIPTDARNDTKRYAYQFYVSPDPKSVAAILGGPVDDDAD